ncbi:MAG: tRNA uridine(34) 5-carboxymethylaminomethyl modification radical SAM/GNAT enzyme Elp3 [Candidatus Thermoplasmatota archaeon]|nr:tRNA uridine(34) 5-carboxymethylaminomethyl modification radical SAM/GNAT enzyme Elp3 [Candidatus Thermoplasmatota archaeon]
MTSAEICKEILSEILARKSSTKEEVHRIKIELCRKYSAPEVPSDADILSYSAKFPNIQNLLTLKPVRSLSGVAVVAVMTSPYACPHGKCGYCPGGIEKGTAQSYTGKEPASLRASMYDYKPYLQMRARLEQLKAIGHSISKIELIVMGGTFTARAQDYQEYFIKSCFDAMNNSESKNLIEAQKKNEVASSRCIGLTIETRPDWCKQEHVEKMLAFGTTRVELGVQTLYDSVLKAVNRGHTTNDTIKATRILKDAGLKVCYHIMPGLPNVSNAEELECFNKIFSSESFKPDMLKIYPTLVIEGTELYEKWKSHEYKELDTESAVELLAKVKAQVPKWIRIQRIQRDIPSQLIIAGVKSSNLRQLVKERMTQLGLQCKCIRCREIGDKELKAEDIKLLREDYNASNGKEIFLSFEESNGSALVAYARLRFPKKPWKEILENNGIIRELKVVGHSVAIGKSAGSKEWQHRGYGRELIKECERIAKEAGANKLFVNSGVGARNYYRKLGYERIDWYMGKVLK